mmetsp:Transcript_81970/g.220123  ORF Transcript_81970/g.220123 Transcript_81970/m.220123 type:complete len:177 (+) Transcript_81970:2437-2967(+)
MTQHMQIISPVSLMSPSFPHSAAPLVHVGPDDRKDRSCWMCATTVAARLSVRPPFVALSTTFARPPHVGILQSDNRRGANQEVARLLRIAAVCILPTCGSFTQGVRTMLAPAVIGPRTWHNTPRSCGCPIRSSSSIYGAPAGRMLFCIHLCRVVSDMPKFGFASFQAIVVELSLFT